MSNLHDEERKMWLSQPEQDAWDRFALGVAGADALLARKVHREAWAAAMRSASTWYGLSAEHRRRLLDEAEAVSD